MMWIKRVAVLAGLAVMLGLCSCYTVVMVPQHTKTTVWETEEEFSDSLETSTQKATVIQNYYIYDDWPGHWYYDPFWVSPYSWHFSTWWWIDYYDPWWRPWYWYGYYPWRPHYYFGLYYGSWDFWPGYYDPYWVYADGWHRVDYKQRPFERRELLPRRREAEPPLFTTSGTSGLGRVEKDAERRASSQFGSEFRRIRRNETESQNPPSMSTERRIRRTESEVSKPTEQSKASSERRVRRTESSSSEKKVRTTREHSSTPSVERRERRNVSPNYSPTPNSSRPQDSPSSHDRSSPTGRSGGDSGRRTRR